MRRLTAVSIVTLLAASVLANSNGVIPGVAGVPLLAARQAPSCGSCHPGSPGANSLLVHVTASARSLDLSQAITVMISSTGGEPTTNDGGFLAETTAGAFAAGASSRIDPTGRFVTHVSKKNGRSWMFGLTAPAQPGPFELYAVVNTVNCSRRPSGDIWALHGFDGTATTGTPVRLFANAAGVKAVGEGCAGAFGNHPVLGSSQASTLGNQSFALELVGATENAPTVFLLGLGRAMPLDLGPIGVPGCFLHVAPIASMTATTGPGQPRRGEGTARLPIPLPANTALRGVVVHAQAAILDPLAGRPTPLTTTGGLSFRLQ